MNQPSALFTQPLSLGRLFGLSFSLYKRFFFQGLLLGLLAMGPSLVLSLLGGNTDISNLELKVFYTVSSLIAFFIVWIYGAIVIFKASSQACLGLPIDWKTAFTVGNQNFLRIIWACIVTSMWCLLMTFLLVIPGIIATVNCFLVCSIMIAEGLPLRKSWTKSKTLIKGFHWRVLLGIAVLWTLYFLIEFFGALVLMVFGGEELLKSISPLITLFASAIYLPLTPIFCALLYYDLRQRKEPLNLNLQNNTTEATLALAT